MHSFAYERMQDHSRESGGEYCFSSQDHEGGRALSPSFYIFALPQDGIAPQSESLANETQFMMTKERKYVQSNFDLVECKLNARILSEKLLILFLEGGEGRSGLLQVRDVILARATSI